MSRGPAYPAPLCLAMSSMANLSLPTCPRPHPMGLGSMRLYQSKLPRQPSHGKVCHKSLQEHSGHKQAQEAITLHAEVLHRGNQEPLHVPTPSPHPSPLSSRPLGTFFPLNLWCSLTSGPLYVLPSTLLLSMPVSLPYSS